MKPEVLYTVTDEDGEVMEITEEVLERRRQATHLMTCLTGIDFKELHLPGIVTLNDAPNLLPDMPERRLIMVSWKIDDAAWKIHTAGRAFISDNDPDARAGVYSFTADSHSWAWGMEPFCDMEPAIKLRERILRLTAELGIVISSYEAEITRK